MTSTTTTNSTSGQCIYLPTPQSTTWGGVNSWSTSAGTSTWTQTNLIFDENGSKIVDQISKVQAFMTKYKDLINGVIFEELVEKVTNLLYQVSCLWGLGYTSASTSAGSWGSSWTNNYTWMQPLSYSQPLTSWTTTTNGSSWVVMDNATTASTTGITYTY